MGDLPRWINNPKVDSTAMFFAWQDYARSLEKAGNNEEVKKLCHLVQYDHVVRPTLLNIMATRIDPPPCPEILVCQTVGCRRCADGRGGYKFRWYDKRWYKGYLAKRREGSWRLGDSEDGESEDSE